MELTKYSEAKDKKMKEIKWKIDINHLKTERFMFFSFNYFAI